MSNDNFLKNKKEVSQEINRKENLLQYTNKSQTLEKITCRKEYNEKSLFGTSNE